jgi:hypothetical protein
VESLTLRLALLRSGPFTVGGGSTTDEFGAEIELR